MKIFVYFLATICACNATFFNLFGGRDQGGHSADSHVTYTISDHDHDHSHSHGHGHSNNHGYGGPPQIIKLILGAGHGGSQSNAGSYSYGSDQGYAPSGYGQGGGSDIQIYRVINQNSGGHHPGHSQASSYRQGSSFSYSSQLHAILPHILQLILANENSGGPDIHTQLSSHFGPMGIATIKRSKDSSFYSGGHVVESGVLKITRIEETPVHSAHPPHGW